MREHRDINTFLVEDDKGHARLIEKNLRRSNVTNEIVTVDDAGGGICLIKNK